jgi:hypothetical protein
VPCHTQLDYYPPDWAMHSGGWSTFAGQDQRGAERIIIRHHVFGLVQIRAKRPFSLFLLFYRTFSKGAPMSVMWIEARQPSPALSRLGGARALCNGQCNAFHRGGATPALCRCNGAYTISSAWRARRKSRKQSTNDARAGAALAPAAGR